MISKVTFFTKRFCSPQHHRFLSVLLYRNTNMASQPEPEVKANDAEQGMIIRAFRGYHPTAELMSKVASPPYDVIDTEEARAACKDNEMSFLNVNKPEIQFAPATDPYSDQVYEMGKTQLDKFCDKKWLVQDEQPSLYIYSQKMGDHEQFGIVTEASAIQYEHNLIKKHELTRKKKEDDRTKLTDVQSANVGPIFLCYKSVKEINECISKHVTDNKPFSDFTSSDGIQHKLWILSDEKSVNTLSSLFQKNVPCSYVADGHHRTASAWRVYKKRKEVLEKAGQYKGDEAFHYFLAVLFPHDQLQILDYNRIIDNFGAVCKDKDGFKKALDADWTFEKIDIKDDVKNDAELNAIIATKKPTDFRMYICGDGWYALSPKEHVLEKVKGDVVKCLDVSILSDYLLDPLLGIKDLRSDPNIKFLGGIHGLAALQKKVEAKKDGVAFGLYHTTIEQLLNVADAQKLMPPKSTWFEPKLRSGVVVRRF
eukprot:229701_1